MVSLNSQTRSFYTFLKWDSNCKSCRFIIQVDTKLFLTTCLQLLVNVFVSSVMSKSRSFTSFNASVAQFVNPWLLRFFNSLFTLSLPIYHLTYDEVGSWYIRLIYGTRYSEGSRPYSPTVIIFLFVALTRSIHQAYCKKTLSVSPQSLDFIPQTSLPYIKIGFINMSKRLSIRRGGSSPIAFILVFILNMAFLAWSHKNWCVFSVHLDWAILLNWWCCPDIYYLSPHRLFLYWNIFLMSLDCQTP